MSVMTNAMLTGFVGSQTAAFFGQEEYERLSSSRRMLDPKLWMVAVLIEHCILCLRFAVFSVVPEVPGWIPKAKMQIENTVSFQWKNPDFLSKNPGFLLRSPDFLLKNG